MTRIVRSRAPLRLGLAGGGSDVAPYCDVYGGAVVNVTIDRYAHAQLKPANGNGVLLRAVDIDAWEVVDGELGTDARAHLRLHRAVYDRMMRDFNGGKPLSVSLSTHVDAPPGTGLGSSSALVVAMVKAFCGLLDLDVDNYTLAKLAFEIERIDLGLEGGRQDQFAAAFGGLNYFQFGDGFSSEVRRVNISRGDLCELEGSLILFSLGASRDSSVIIRQQIDALASGGSSLEAMHRLKSEALQMKVALESGAMGDVAAIISRGWSAKKATAAGVTNPWVEEVYDCALRCGARGGKISGAGGGGVLMLVVDPADRVEITRRMLSELPSLECLAAHFTAEGAEQWSAQSSDWAASNQT